MPPQIQSSGKMETEPIPAGWDAIESCELLYWRGMDILESHWVRTQAFAEYEPGSDGFQAMGTGSRWIRRRS